MVQLQGPRGEGNSPSLIQDRQSLVSLPHHLSIDKKHDNRPVPFVWAVVLPEDMVAAGLLNEAFSGLGGLPFIPHKLCHSVTRAVTVAPPWRWGGVKPFGGYESWRATTDFPGAFLNHKVLG